MNLSSTLINLGLFVQNVKQKNDGNYVRIPEEDEE